MQANGIEKDVSQELGIQSDQEDAETKDIEQHAMSKDDANFVSELGWLTAASVLVAGIAASL